MSRLPIRLRLTLPFALGDGARACRDGLPDLPAGRRALLASVDQNLQRTGRRGAVPRRRGHDAHRPGRQRAARRSHRSCSRRRHGRRLDADGPAALLSRRRFARVSPATGLRYEAIPGLAATGGSLAVPVAGRRPPRGARASAARSRRASETLHRLRREFLFAAPASALLAIARRLRARGGRSPARRGDAPARGRDHARRRRAADCRFRAARDEISALAETLNEMLARLEAAFEHERRFVADASHELRTPLALLQAELELALRRPRSHEELEAAARSAADETDRLARLAEDLLLIARADQGRAAAAARNRRRGRARSSTVARPVRRSRRAARPRHSRSRASTSAVRGRRPAAARAGARQSRRQRARARRRFGRPLALARDDDARRAARDRRRAPVSRRGSSPRAFDRFSRADDGRSIARNRPRPRDRRADRPGARRRGARREPPAGGADVWITLPLRGPSVRRFAARAHELSSAGGSQLDGR